MSDIALNLPPNPAEVVEQADYVKHINAVAKKLDCVRVVVALSDERSYSKRTKNLNVSAAARLCGLSNRQFSAKLDKLREALGIDLGTSA